MKATIARIVHLYKVKTFLAFKCIAVGVALGIVATMCLAQLASTQLIGGRQNRAGRDGQPYFARDAQRQARTHP